MVHLLHKWKYYFQSIGDRDYQLRCCVRCGKTMVLDDSGIWAVVTSMERRRDER